MTIDQLITLWQMNLVGFREARDLLGKLEPDFAEVRLSDLDDLETGLPEDFLGE